MEKNGKKMMTLVVVAINILCGNVYASTTYDLSGGDKSVDAYPGDDVYFQKTGSASWNIFPSSLASQYTADELKGEIIKAKGPGSFERGGKTGTLRYVQNLSDISVTVSGNSATISGIHSFFAGGGGANVVRKPDGSVFDMNKTFYTVTGSSNGPEAWKIQFGDGVNASYTENILIPFSTPPTQYTVSFDANGGSPTPANQTVSAGGKATEPTAPSKSGYTFDGWYNGTTKWNFSTDVVTTNLQLKAKWSIPDGIETIENSELKIWSANGALYIEAPTSGIAYIYAISGNFVRVVEYHEGENTIYTLFKGLYIVKIETSIFKVIVR